MKKILIVLAIVLPLALATIAIAPSVLRRYEQEKLVHDVCITLNERTLKQAQERLRSAKALITTPELKVFVEDLNRLKSDDDGKILLFLEKYAGKDNPISRAKFVF